LQRRVQLKPDRERAIRKGHPWVFSGAIQGDEGAEGAALAAVESASGERLGIGFWSPRSQIRVRMLAGETSWRGERFFSERLAAALALRAAVVPAGTTGYRVLNAEGDSLPGWVVDRFGDVLVSQITVAGLAALREEALAALAAAMPGLAILENDDLAARRLEGLPLEDRAFRGVIPEEIGFEEGGHRFLAALSGGQKTGFYCDQRENRQLAARLAARRDVLDLFSHAGAFAVYCLKAGARRVVGVESSAPAVERFQRHLDVNGCPREAATCIAGDVFEDLRSRQERYGLVVCDPPPFAKRRADVERAARAYKDLNRLAMRRLQPGGFLLTFTCSGAIDATLFRQILFAAAEEAKVQLALLAPLAAAPDHPVSVYHPEGEYLKGWWCVRTDGG